MPRGEPTTPTRLCDQDAARLKEIARVLGISDAEAFRRYGRRNLERAHRVVLANASNETGNPVG